METCKKRTGGSEFYLEIFKQGSPDVVFSPFFVRVLLAPGGPSGGNRLRKLVGQDPVWEISPYGRAYLERDIYTENLHFIGLP